MKSKIVIIDDEIVIANSIKIFLEREGFSAYTLCPDENIIKNIININPDLIITDYLMPQYDGASLIFDIRKIKPELPIIIITGYKRSVQLEESKKTKIMSKPFLLEELLLEFKKFKI